MEANYDDINNIDHIIKYYKNKLNEEEKLAFELKLRVDENFNKNYEAYQKYFLQIEELNFRQQLNEIKQNSKNKPEIVFPSNNIKTIGKNKIWLIAASFIGLLLFSIVLINFISDKENNFFAKNELKNNPKIKDKLDSDADGIFDHLDKCPLEFGVKENRGCPKESKKPKTNIKTKVAINFNKIAEKYFIPIAYNQLNVGSEVVYNRPALNNAKSFYNAKDYNKAADSFQYFLQNNKQPEDIFATTSEANYLNEKIKLFIIVSKYLSATHNNTSLISELEKLKNSQQVSIKNYATYYHALIYLKTKDKSSSLKNLNSINNSADFVFTKELSEIIALLN